MLSLVLDVGLELVPNAVLELVAVRLLEGIGREADLILYALRLAVLLLLDGRVVGDHVAIVATRFGETPPRAAQLP